MSRSVRVKFCGLTRREDIHTAVRLDADYLGFIFAPGGPRTLDVGQAATLLAGSETAAAARVGVFRDQPARFVNEVVERCKLDFVQLHGHEPRDFPGALQVPVLRAIAVRAADRAQARDAATLDAEGTWRWQEDDPDSHLGQAVPLAPNVFAALLDPEDAAGRSGGLGITAEAGAIDAALRRLPHDARIFLSGGLTPENVAAAVRIWHPFAVDVSSGVESAPGIKDARRMADFVAFLEGES